MPHPENPPPPETLPPPAASASVRLHPSHYAFMRALVQGVALREAWARYLHPGDATGADLAHMRQVVQSIRDAFAVAARRERRHGIARLVLVDLSRVPDDAVALPSLEDFAAERGLEDFSEAEQIEAYEAAHGRTAQRLGRRARLVVRQLEALRWLESLSQRPPQLDDPVDAWLHPQLAGRLAAAGLGTLRQLCHRIQHAPGRWWRPVRAVGTLKALRVERWLAEHRQSLSLPPELCARLGLAPSGDRSAAAAERARAPAPTAPRAPTPAAANSQAVRPLEHFHPSAAPGTTLGLQHRPVVDARIGPSADRDRLLGWLATKGQASEHTRRAYRREAERFLLWAVLVRGVTLSSVTAADVQAYLAFVADPQPRAEWCGPRHQPRWSVLWRPFEGPLSAGARRQTVAVLRNLYEHLCRHGHAASNPWLGAAAGCSPRPALDSGRSLSAAQAAWVERRLHLLPDTAAHQRLRVAWQLMQGAGLRLSEAVAARLADLRSDGPGRSNTPAPAPQPMLWLRVPGPGQRDRELGLPPAAVQALEASLPGRGLLPDPLHPGQADAWLLGQAADFSQRAPGLAAGRPLDPRRGIGAATLADQFKRLFRQCAADARSAGALADADALRRASTHWLRHTHGVQQLARGLPVATAQRRLGHASPATTALYRRMAERAGQNAANPHAPIR